MTITGRWVVLVAAVLLLAACPTNRGPQERTTPSPATSPAPTPAPTPAPSPTPTPTTPAEVPRLQLQPVVTEGLQAPVLVTAPPDDPRLFVLELAGRVRIVSDGQLAPEPFLDLTERVATGGEFGLLGLAFHPDYADSGRLFVHHSRAGDGATQLVEYRVSSDPDRADPASARLLLTLEQPASNHNGGTVAFGPDGYLYLGLGDGGGARDTFGHGQDPATLYAALLRLDVDSQPAAGRAYAIPPDNPFADGAGGAPEVWAYGLRNPWRFSFDRGTGDLLIGDVGQSAREEIDVRPAGGGGANFGWPAMEGTVCHAPEGCDGRGFTPPVLDYPSDGANCGVVGGHVYRGDAMPGLAGRYVYGDLCAGWVRSVRYQDGSVSDERDHTGELGSLGERTGGYRLMSFGQDAAGELYVGTADGRVHRLVAGVG
ncbi:MAG TPA: PQQ-dependent sugar dehydrogenase [Nitriliruptorales bacterium]|nr:PQQ-dependent sugar dehydrogenase [Nitriliruptorales bacterium]